MTSRIVYLLVAILVLGAGLVPVASAAGGPENAPAIKVGSTVENLQAAFSGESNAHARYLAFAERAQGEGYGEVASLFRAAARAEAIHASNHAAVLRKLGATPDPQLGNPDVKSTKENLQAAIKGETYERDVMYPAFITKARAESNPDALRTFNYANTAEAGHANLYTDAAGNLEKMRGKSRMYQVCPVCGFTVARIDFAKCPSCFSPKERYQAVS